MESHKRERRTRKAESSSGKEESGQACPVLPFVRPQTRIEIEAHLYLLSS